MELENITPENLPLDFVKNYLRVEHELDDIEISLMIKSAQSYVKNYLKLSKEETIEDIELVIPTLALISHFYENKTITMKSNDKMDLFFSSTLDMHRGDIL